jgi:hypothetical protein
MISFPVVVMALAWYGSTATAQDIPRSHRDLDWQAPNRWVHVDNLDAQKAAAFEAARRGWLAALHVDGNLLGDGRPLFWHARSTPAGQTFFTFYPFAKLTDLDARREMIKQTQALVGEAAVQQYDTGDAALVSPHYSQLWRRVADFDVAGPATTSLNELTAATGRLEVHTVDIVQWDAFEQAWRRVADALVAAGYPLACRAFANSYGKGEYMLWWLAPDAAAYAGAPPVREVVARQLGEAQSAEIFAVLDRAFPVVESYEVERRPDLSNLGE